MVIINKFNWELRVASATSSGKKRRKKTTNSMNLIPTQMNWQKVWIVIIACAYVSSEGDNDHYNQINKQIYLFQYMTVFIMEKSQS